MTARRLLLLTVLLPLVGAIASLRGLQSTQYSAGGGEDYTIKFVVQLDASRTGEFVVTVRSAKAPLAARSKSGNNRPAIVVSTSRSAMPMPRTKPSPRPRQSYACQATTDDWFKTH